MDIYKLKDAESYQTSEGIMVPLFAYENVSVVHINLPAGLQVKPHSHPAATIMIITKGSVKAIGNDAVDLGIGDLAFFSGRYGDGIGDL